ncbi:unnamed protein product [Urochloa humidicola]
MASKRTTRRQAGKEESIINCLPTELIEHVFYSLPASCLLQCTSVCKKWCKIIRDSQFALAHLQHASSCTLLFSPQGSVSGKLYPSDAIIFDEAWSPSKSAVPVIGPDDRICGSCNGLLCLHTPTSTIKIANLATGECLHLKKPTKSLKDDHFSFYRFGFHPATKEYMVIHFSQENSTLPVGRFNVIQVYTLGEDKWNDVVTPESLSLNCVKNSGVAIVDGTMYWLAEDIASDWQHIVVSFDLGEESFSQIQLPAVDLEDWALGIGGDRHYWITEIDGKVHRQLMILEIKEMSQHFPDGIQQRISMEMDLVSQHLPDYPDQHPSPVPRRLNWVEKMQDKKKLAARLERHEVSNAAVDASLDRALSCVSAYNLDQSKAFSKLVIFRATLIHSVSAIVVMMQN